MVLAFVNTANHFSERSVPQRTGFASVAQSDTTITTTVSSVPVSTIVLCDDVLNADLPLGSENVRITLSIFDPPFGLRLAPWDEVVTSSFFHNISYAVIATKYCTFR